MKSNVFAKLLQNLRSATPVFGSAMAGRTKAGQAKTALVNLINSPSAFSESELSSDFSPLMHQTPIGNAIRGLSTHLSGASPA